MHAVKNDLTLCSFSDSISEKENILQAMTRLVHRTEAYLLSSSGSFERTHVSLTELTDQVVEQLQDPRVQMSTPTNATVRGSAHLLGTLIAELIDNALRYSRDDVYVSVHKTATHAVLRIEDYGCGLSNEVSSRIAEPFSPPGTKISGIGLGLALVWDITQSHSGSMTIHTEQDEGTTILVVLDLV